MTLTQFVLNPHIQNMSRLYIKLMHRDDRVQLEGLYEYIPFDSLSDTAKKAAKIMEQEELIFINDHNVEFSPCFDSLIGRKLQYLYDIASRVYRNDVATNFADCPDDLLPF